MAHAGEVPGARMMKRPRGLGLERHAANSRRLSRMDKAWLSWKVRWEIVSRLTDELARLGRQGCSPQFTFLFPRIPRQEGAEDLPDFTDALEPAHH
ncbi:MAG: hypothetical protein WEA77_03420 [Hyphomonas sp.]|uniref:hypothetical protein n=1 Tax=Hyphomonas sp. TaxID=87 RepID=UPI0034A0720A